MIDLKELHEAQKSREFAEDMTRLVREEKQEAEHLVYSCPGCGVPRKSDTRCANCS